MKFNRHPNEDAPRGHARDAIERMILSRGYKVGDQPPTYRDLAEHLGIAMRTVVRVMHQLADEGVVHLLHGKGVFVKRLPAGSGQLAKVGLVYPASRCHRLCHRLSQPFLFCPAAVAAKSRPRRSRGILIVMTPVVPSGMMAIL